MTDKERELSIFLNKFCSKYDLGGIYSDLTINMGGKLGGTISLVRKVIHNNKIYPSLNIACSTLNFNITDVINDIKENKSREFRIKYKNKR